MNMDKFTVSRPQELRTDCNASATKKQTMNEENDEHRDMDMDDDELVVQKHDISKFFNDRI